MSSRAFSCHTIYWYMTVRSWWIWAAFLNKGNGLDGKQQYNDIQTASYEWVFHVDWIVQSAKLVTHCLCPSVILRSYLALCCDSIQCSFGSRKSSDASIKLVWKLRRAFVEIKLPPAETHFPVWTALSDHLCFCHWYNLALLPLNHSNSATMSPSQNFNGVLHLISISTFFKTVWWSLSWLCIRHESHSDDFLNASTHQASGMYSACIELELNHICWCKHCHICWCSPCTMLRNSSNNEMHEPHLIEQTIILHQLGLSVSMQSLLLSLCSLYREYNWHL